MPQNRYSRRLPFPTHSTREPKATITSKTQNSKQHHLRAALEPYQRRHHLQRRRQRQKKDITAAAFVTGAQYEGDLADEQYSKFFVKGNLSQDAIRQLYTYNVALLRLEYGLNDVFLKTASAVKLEGEEIPYGILSVRIPKVEQIHKLKGYENIYTASINPVFVADNYLIPLHIRAFAAHVDGKYRNLLIIGPASETDIFDQAGLDIILSKPKDEKK